MNKEQAKKELKTMIELRKKIEISLKDAPEGRMRCAMRKGKQYQYYYVNSELFTGPLGTYIKKNNMELARKLAQKEYETDLLKVLVKKSKSLERFIKNYPDIEFDEIYNQMPQAKRILVQPYYLPDEMFLATWTARFQGERNRFPIENGFVTEKGELVRSKSEKIIADKLFYYQIPYIYEASLTLQNNHIIFPDFTILNLRTRKTYFFEHFGMMDNPDYCKKALEKIEAYETNHFYLNESLLISMESSLKGISIKQIDSLIQRFLL